MVLFYITSLAGYTGLFYTVENESEAQYEVSFLREGLKMRIE